MSMRFLLIFLFLATVLEYACCQELPAMIEIETPQDDCSAAFYPVTACVRDGTRSVYIQFLECQGEGASVSRAYFNWFRLLTKDGKLMHGDDATLPVTWKELVIPSYFKRAGYLTVFYKKSAVEVEESTLQIKIPNCSEIKSAIS